MTHSLPPARILAVETSCDETAAAIIENGCFQLSNVVASQMEVHARYGGVYPEVASRQHVLSIIPVVDQALTQAHLALTDLDAITVTRGPGLAGSLVVGMNAAKGLAVGTGLPLIGVNHLEGHLYSAWIFDNPPHGENEKTSLPPELQFPLMALLVSGGHTELILMENHLTYHRLGATLDDAAGEAFDKGARLLGFGYPGGPAVQTAGEGGDAERFTFPRAWLEGRWDFSFSGVKTALLHEVRRLEEDHNPLPVADLAASFQAAIVDVLVSKTLLAAREYSVKGILIAGGVSANRNLRDAFSEQEDFPIHIPLLSLCTDNAAMIAAAGYYRYVHNHRDTLDIDVLPTWTLS